MRTSEAVTEAPGVRWTLLAAGLIYAVISAGAIAVLRILARAPTEEAYES